MRIPGFRGMWIGSLGREVGYASRQCVFISFLLNTPFASVLLTLLQ